MPSPRFRNKKKDGTARLLFRGQANSEWKLQTTLERIGRSTMPLQDYIKNCESARRFLGNIIPSNFEFNPSFPCGFRDVQTEFPNYEFSAFLRHHGFPSPLLDWTESPFVAAFFAFRQVESTVENVRIYGYQSDTGKGRGLSGNFPQIQPQGPFATIHERHLTQQCWYTWCFRENNSTVEICPHEEGFTNSRAGQDEIYTWDISASERDAVLADLFQMNITPYSLFRSVDSAMETASLRLF